MERNWSEEKQGEPAKDVEEWKKGKKEKAWKKIEKRNEVGRERGEEMRLDVGEDDWKNTKTVER